MQLKLLKKKIKEEHQTVKKNPGRIPMILGALK